MHEITIYNAGKMPSEDQRVKTLRFFRRNFPSDYYTADAKAKMLSIYSDEGHAKAQIERGRTWLVASAAAESAVAGIVWMDERNQDQNLGQHHIGWVIVGKDSRRQGMGTQLLQEAEKVARGLGGRIMTCSIEPENVPSIALFGGQGYSNIPPEIRETMGFDPHGLGVDLAYMKRLD